MTITNHQAKELTKKKVHYSYKYPVNRNLAYHKRYKSYKVTMKIILDTRFILD